MPDPTFAFSAWTSFDAFASTGLAPSSESGPFETADCAVAAADCSPAGILRRRVPLSLLMKPRGKERYSLREAQKIRFQTSFSFIADLRGGRSTVHEARETPPDCVVEAASVLLKFGCSMGTNQSTESCLFTSCLNTPSCLAMSESNVPSSAKRPPASTFTWSAA